MAKYFQLKALTGVLLLVALSATCSFARPYYYFFQEPAKPVEHIQQAGAEVQQQIQQAPGQIQQQIGQLANGQQQQPGPIGQKFGGHLTELYSHGSSAVRNAVDTVQPDLKNIGQDLTDVYHQTRETVTKKIEPITHTVRPYIDKAQKMIGEQISSAREEIPKALTKVGEQVQGVWGKIKSTTQSEGEQAGEQIQDAGKQVQHHLQENQVI